jgi:hypothetical protein
MYRWDWCHHEHDGLKDVELSVKYSHKFMKMLHGRRIPTHVSMLLIVNPPSWFGSICTIMRRMLSKPFRSNVFESHFMKWILFLRIGSSDFYRMRCIRDARRRIKS